MSDVGVSDLRVRLHIRLASGVCHGRKLHPNMPSVCGSPFMYNENSEICSVWPNHIYLRPLIFPLWISKPDCSPSPAHYHVTQAFIYTDTLITLIVPVILMVVAMIPIICRLFRSHSWRRGMTNSSSNPRSQNPITKVTRMLLAVSTTFFLMHLPSHVIRLQILINYFLQGYIDTPAVEAIIQTIALQIYYLSLGINILIYLVFGSQFREVFKQTFFPGCAISSTASNAYIYPSEQYMLVPRNVVSAEVKLGSANSTEDN